MYARTIKQHLMFLLLSEDKKYIETIHKMLVGDETSPYSDASGASTEQK
jgi:hypothetical protein